MGEFLVAFVGPATTLVMAGVFFIAQMLTHGTLSDTLHWLAFISLLFAGLNTLPGFPLDGGRMFLAIVWGVTGSRRTGLRAAGYAGILVGSLMIAVGAWYLLRADPFLAFFIAYIGFTIVATGRSMDRRIALRDQLARGTVAEAMRPAPPMVPVELSLADALDRYLREDPDSSFPVVDAGGRIVGTISMATARRVGGRDPLRSVRTGMAPLALTRTVGPRESLDDVLEWLGGRDGLVLDGERVVGAIGSADVERWYRRVVEGRPEATAAGIPPRPDM
jgi:CBS domain-containing protein